jgi:centrin-3
LTYHELKVALKALGFNLSKPDLLNILSAHAPASTHPSRQKLSQQAFQNVAASRILARDPKEEILRAFELFDEGGKGIITVQDLRRVARELGESIEDAELQAMIEEFDLDGDEGINAEEFIGICLQ